MESAAFDADFPGSSRVEWSPAAALASAARGPFDPEKKRGFVPLPPPATP